MAKMSRRERWAAKTGKDKKAYKASAEGKAVGKIKKYYKESGEFIKKQYKLDKKKLQKDFELVLEEAGFTKTNLLQDYSRNIKRLEENKTTDVEELNYYLDTTRGRTQEDLDVSLGKALRNFNLTMDREAESLASRNLVFSGLRGVRGKEEGNITEEYKSEKADYMRGAERSFEDLARLEFVKNAAIEKQYGRDIEDTTTTKERGVQDIDFGVKKAEQTKTSSLKNIKLGKKKDLWSEDYAKDTDIALVESQFDSQRKQEKYEPALWETLMS
jgi:hypothetical protein